jgi:lysozyme
MRQINSKGLDLIKKSEGLKLVAYQDQAGVWTIGYGHTKGVFRGMNITEAQAEAFLLDNIANACRAVETYVKVTLTDNQFAALVDFTFNEGDGALEHSTLLRLLNSGDFIGAAQQFLVWDKIHEDGRVVESSDLKLRRQSEQVLFLENEYVAGASQ